MELYVHCTCVYMYMYTCCLMRDEMEGRKKQARSNRQTRQSNSLGSRPPPFRARFNYAHA